MNLLLSIILVIVLIIIPVVGILTLNAYWIFGILIPYSAIVLFFIGLIYRILKWSNSPVPFRIPTTCGQAKGLYWIKTNPIDNPCSLSTVIIRMFLEVFLLRSLFRNIKVEKYEEGDLRYTSTKWLWLFAIAFHYSFFIVIIRHLRFFTEPIPFWVKLVERMDTFFEMGLPIPSLSGFKISLPVLAQSGIILLIAVSILLLRRFFIPAVRYISIAADWFPLLLILFIVKIGIIMRYLLKVDVVAIKKLTMSLILGNPILPSEPISIFFYIHLFLVSILIGYLPFSKLIHFAGIWLSPTRNLVNNSREKRHINPWNPEVKFHTYDKYENEFRKQMIEAEIPVEKVI